MSAVLFRCLVSRSRTRRPLPLSFVAADEAEVAFAAWLDAGLAGRPQVRIDGDCWIATDGFREIRVSILTKEEQ